MILNLKGLCLEDCVMAINVFNVPNGFNAETIEEHKLEELLKDVKSHMVTAHITDNYYPSECYQLAMVCQVLWNELKGNKVVDR